MEEDSEAPMNSPDAYSITYLLGAGMIVDLFEWLIVAAAMLVTSFSLGILLGKWRKRRLAKI